MSNDKLDLFILLLAQIYDCDGSDIVTQVPEPTSGPSSAKTTVPTIDPTFADQDPIGIPHFWFNTVKLIRCPGVY